MLIIFECNIKSNQNEVACPIWTESQFSVAFVRNDVTRNVQAKQNQ